MQFPAVALIQGPNTVKKRSAGSLSSPAAATLVPWRENKQERAPRAKQRKTRPYCHIAPLSAARRERTTYNRLLPAPAFAQAVQGRLGRRDTYSTLTKLASER